MHDSLASTVISGEATGLSAHVLAQLVESARDGVTVFDRECRYVTWNGEMERMTGVRRDEVLGRNMFEVFPFLKTNGAAEQVQRAMEGEGSGPTRRPFQLPHLGREGFYEARYVPLRDESGAVCAVASFIRDVTDRQLADDERRRVDQRLQELMEQSPVSTQVFAADGTPRYVNPAWERFFGVTLADIPGYNVLADPQLDAMGVTPLLRRAFAGETVSFPAVPYVPDRGMYLGQQRWCVALAYPVKDEAGRVEEVVLLHNDITDERQARREMRTVAAHARCILWQADVRGLEGWREDATGALGRFQWDLVVQDEQAAHRVLPLDVRPGETYTHAWHASADRADLKQIWATSAGALIAGMPTYWHEFRCYDRDGQVRWLQETVTVHEVGPGRWRTVGVVTDATGAKRTEQALRESERAARESAERNRRLILELDHRVRNNVAGLLSLVSLMSTRATSVGGFAKAVEGRILAMSHAHELLASTDWRAVDLRRLVSSSLATLQHTSRHTAEVVADGPAVAISPEQAMPLTMILAEFFTNSAKYGAHSRAGGRVEIRWGREEERVRLEWRESGGPTVTEVAPPSLGTELVQAFATRELRGRVELSFPAEGARHVLEFPAEGT